MLTPAEFAQLQASADNGLLMLFVTVLFGLLIAAALVRLFHIRLRIPAPTLPLIPLPFILAVGLALRVVGLFQPLWYDETFTARMASIPLGNFPAAVAGDVHPPLFYLLDWLSVHLIGDTPLGLRLWPLLFGWLGIWIMYRLALALGLSERYARLAALVLALLPASIYYSTEARGYSLLADLVLFAFLALLLDQRKRFALALALIPLTHNLGYFYFGALFALALYRYLYVYRRPRDWPRPDWRIPYFKLLIFAPLPGLLWLPVMLFQASLIGGGFWLGKLSPGMILGALLEVTITSKQSQSTVIAAYVLVIGLTALSLWGLRRWLRLQWPLLIMALAVPAAVAAVSLVWRNVYLARAVMPSVLLVAILWARFVETSPRALYGLVPLLALGLIGFYAPTTPRPDVGELFASCRNQNVYLTDIPAATFAAYYLQDEPMTVWPDAGHDLNQTIPLQTELAMEFTPRPLAQVTGPVCVVMFDTPLTKAGERAFVDQQVAPRARRMQYVAVNETWHIHIYELD